MRRQKYQNSELSPQIDYINNAIYTQSVYAWNIIVGQICGVSECSDDQFRSSEKSRCVFILLNTSLKLHNYH